MFLHAAGFWVLPGDYKFIEWNISPDHFQYLSISLI